MKLRKMICSVVAMLVLSMSVGITAVYAEAPVTPVWDKDRYSVGATISNVLEKSEKTITVLHGQYEVPIYLTGSPTVIERLDTDVIVVQSCEYNGDEIVAQMFTMESAFWDEYITIDGSFMGYIYTKNESSGEKVAEFFLVTDINLLKPAEAALVSGVKKLDSSKSATPTASKVFLNDKEISFDAYNIEGNNYFKLRDLAYILSGTEKQFDVSWDGAANAIILLANNAYTVAGGELAKGDGTTKNAKLTTSKIMLDGKEIQLTAYNIGGNNYFKLRDIGKTFDFATDWDGANNAIKIDTSKPYTE